MGWHWADCWFTEVSAPAAPCMLPYTVFPSFCETNLQCSKTDSKSEGSIWAIPWKQTLLIYNTAFIVWDTRRSSPGSCEQAGPTAKHEDPLLNSAKKKGFPRKTVSWPEAMSPGLLTKHLCKMIFCSSLSASIPRAQGAGMPFRMGPG